MITGGIIVVCLIVLDFITKQLIMKNVDVNTEVIVIIKDFFSIVHHKNDGAAFSMQIPLWALILTTVFGLAVFCYLFTKIDFKKKKIYSISVCLLVAGTIGNFIDRLFYPEHKVVDFLSFDLYYYFVKDGVWGWQTFKFATFNVADICLTSGAIGFLIYILFLESRTKNERV